MMWGCGVYSEKRKFNAGIGIFLIDKSHVQITGYLSHAGSSTVALEGSMISGEHKIKAGSMSDNGCVLSQSSW